MKREVREDREQISAVTFALMLRMVPQIGEKTLGRLLRTGLSQQISPEDFLSLPSAIWRSQFELDKRTVSILEAERTTLPGKALEMARFLRLSEVQLITCMSVSYPDRMERFDDSPPPMLMAKGDIRLFSPEDRNGFTFTVAISRGHSPFSLDKQEEVSNSLIAQGGIPVTGHDRIPYQRLALTAQRQNRPVLYLLDRGLREVLGPEMDRPPFAAARIREQTFNSERDLMVSPFRLDDHSLGSNNRRRDRLVAAMSDIIVAVDVSPEGEMLGLCRRAQAQGKAVVACSEGRGGCSTLLREGAVPLTKSIDASALLQPAG